MDGKKESVRCYQLTDRKNIAGEASHVRTLSR